MPLPFKDKFEAITESSFFFVIYYSFAGRLTFGSGWTFCQFSLNSNLGNYWNLKVLKIFNYLGHCQCFFSYVMLSSVLGERVFHARWCWFIDTNATTIIINSFLASLLPWMSIPNILTRNARIKINQRKQG